MEVIPTRVLSLHLSKCILHTCGGDPVCSCWWCDVSKYSPHMWRWSQVQNSKGQRKRVFSTHVEVILLLKIAKMRFLSILHVCGGDPRNTIYICDQPKYSPRMWRWSYHASSAIHTITVFSTYVEVIPRYTRGCPSHIRILHVCGGDPNWFSGCSSGLRYSPHMLRVLLSLSAQINSL